MKEITLYREDNGQYSTSEARQDDVSGVYVQKEHLTELQKENDELRAYANRLANALVICDAQHDGSYIGGGHVREVLDESLAQSLAEIKAEAVFGIMDNVNDFEAFGSPKMMEVKDIIEYANKLKGGE
tara:strand:+ start:19406 stop:19789 length:384 start_codon:yes stop_codon:yes gene_type:complete